MSLRSVASAAFDVASVPSPTSGIETRATVCDGLTSTSIEPLFSLCATAWDLIPAMARCVAGEEHASHRRHHSEPGDEHGPSGGRGGCFQCSPCAAARRPLLTLALDVEERVVDTDGEADQQDHRVDVLVHRDQVTRHGGEED